MGINESKLRFSPLIWASQDARKRSVGWATPEFPGQLALLLVAQWLERWIDKKKYGAKILRKKEPKRSLVSYPN